MSEVDAHHEPGPGLGKYAREVASSGRDVNHVVSTANLRKAHGLSSPCGVAT